MARRPSTFIRSRVGELFFCDHFSTDSLLFSSSFIIQLLSLRMCEHGLRGFPSLQMMLVFCKIAFCVWILCCFLTVGCHTVVSADICELLDGGGFAQFAPGVIRGTL